MDKKLFRLDMALAVEASNADEAFEILTTDETMKQIKRLIIESKSTITEMFASENDDKPMIIN
jgi:hypothetical protein